MTDEIRQVAALDHEITVSGPGGEKHTFNIYDFAESHTAKITENEMKHLGLLGELNGPLGGPKVIVDVGANVGVYSVAASKMYPGARIVSIEPVPDTCELMVMNCVRNGLTPESGRHAHVSGAISADTCGVKLGNYPTNTGQASFQHVGDAPEVVFVPTMRLEDLLDTLGIQRADFVKIDVEGMEYQILWDIKDWNRIAALSVELHGILNWPKDINAAIYERVTTFLSEQAQLHESLVVEVRWPNDITPLPRSLGVFDPKTYAFTFGAKT